MNAPHGSGVLPLHRLEVPAPRVPPFAIGSFDTIGSQSRATYPHRHTFHEIVHVTAGRGRHVLDATRRTLAPPHLCVIAPGQVHHWEETRGLRGVVVLFDDDFLADRPGDRELLRRLCGRPWLYLHAEADARVGELLAVMRREHREQGPGSASVLQAYLHILLVTAARLPGEPPGGDARTGAGGTERAALADRFSAMLDESPGAAGARTVREHAAELGVSVSALGEAVKSATGRSPGALIRGAQTLEAKRLLAGTTLTVSRVARAAGFTDPAYFCRFFRRETGVSPGEFRRLVGAHAGRIHHGDRSESIDAPDGAP